MTNVVIGAASGMGAAVARQLARAVGSCSPTRIPPAWSRSSRSSGGDVEAVACDVTDQAQVDALFAKVDDLGALVHTAGISGSMAPGRRILEVNLIGPARVLRAAEPLLRPGSVAVVVASQSGYMVPESPELFAVLEDPLSPGFFDELGKFFDVDVPSLAYQVSKRGVHRLVRRAQPRGASGARASCRFRPGSTTRR